MIKRPTYEDLEEEVLQLKHELGLRVNANKADAIRKGLRLTPSEAKIVLALYDAKGAMRVEVLNKLCARYATTDEGGKGTTVRITSIRRILGFDFIDTHRNFGYALSYVGRERVDQVLTAT